VAPRQTWLDARADELVAALHDLGLVLPREHAKRVLAQQVQQVAAEMRVTERTARRYLVSDALQGMAENLALELADEQPGADLLAGPRTIPMSIAVIGRTVAALAEATQVRRSGDETYAADGGAQVISMLGQVLSECPIPGGDPCLVPQGALTRGARLLATAADTLREDPGSTPKVDAGQQPRLAEAMERDAAVLRELVDNYGSSVGPSPDHARSFGVSGR